MVEDFFLTSRRMYCRHPAENVGGPHDVCAFQGGGEPKVEGDASHICQQNKAAVDDGEVPLQATKIVAFHIVLSPYLLDNRRCEGVCSKHEEGEAGRDLGNGAFFCGLVNEDNSIEGG